MTIGTNSSPLAGKVSGHKLTARMVKSRLDTELVGNVSLRVVDIGRPDAWEVQAAVSSRWRSSSSRCAARASS